MRASLLLSPPLDLGMVTASLEAIEEQLELHVTRQERDGISVLAEDWRASNGAKGRRGSTDVSAR
jgi:hypothetical protein